MTKHIHQLLAELKPARTSTSSARSSPRPVRLVSGLLAAALPVLIACNPGSLSSDPPVRCAETGVQCQLPEGPLGVCERSPCAPGEIPPCFKCTPQH